MNPPPFARAGVIVCTLVAGLEIARQAGADANGPNLFGFVDPTGLVRTYNINGATDFQRPVLPAPRHERAIVRFVPSARRRLDHHAGARAGALRGH